MTTSVGAWGELMEAALELVQTSVRTNEMLAASQTVIASRMGSMAGAARHPWGEDQFELARMVPEKISAFSDAGEAVWRQWTQVFEQASQHFGEVGSLSPGAWNMMKMSQLSARTATLATAVMVNTLRSGSVVLEPIHKQATANARRLSARA